MKPKKEEFTVSQIQRKKEGLNINFEVLVYSGEEHCFDKYKKDSDRHPDDSFIEKLNSLKKYVANIIHYGSINKIVGDIKFKVTEDQSRYLMRLHQTLVSKIQINGIKMFGGNGYVDKCIIKYSLEGLSTQNMDTETYKIDLSENTDVHGFEDELNELCMELTECSYAYLFENKGGQGDLFEAETDEETSE